MHMYLLRCSRLTLSAMQVLELCEEWVIRDLWERVSGPIIIATSEREWQHMFDWVLSGGCAELSEGIPVEVSSLRIRYLLITAELLPLLQHLSTTLHWTSFGQLRLLDIIVV